MRGEPRLSFRKLGHLLKAKGIMGKHRVPLWEIALGLCEFQKDGGGTGPFGEGCEPVAVWYLNKKVGETGIKLHQGPLPPVIVVGETWVKVGERRL